jgi:histone acetyltransferase (RNA polymerase elongator complex component)
VAHAVTFDATGTECLVIGEIGTTGEVAGTGRALLSHLATQALMSGLEISCIADVGARGFYTHLGFVQDPPRDVRYVWGREAMLTALAQLSTPEIA